MFRRSLALVTLSLVALTVGCDSVSGPTDEEIDGTLADAIEALEDAMYAAVHIEDASDLEDISFQDAYDLFATVYGEAPENDLAAFGYALTTIFLMEDNPDVEDLIQDLDELLNEGEDDGSPIVMGLLAPVASVGLARGGLPLDFSTTGFRSVANAGLVAVAFPQGPTFAEVPEIGTIQDVLREVVRPQLTEALDALAQIDDPDFVFTITERMQGEDEDTGNPLELDYTEVLALQAGLSVALAATEVATAYILEPDPLDGGAALVAALDPESTFLTLAPMGADGLSNALDRLRDATQFLLDGLANLQAETDDQDDDIIKYDPTGTGSGVTAEDIADAEEIIGDIQDALDGETVITIPGDGDEDFEITANLSEFFITPIQDFKALLPAYDVFLAFEGEDEVALLRWDALNLDEWVIPDPSISGILPEMETTADLLDTFPLDDLFVGSSVAGGRYGLISIDDFDCYANIFEEGQGCLVNDEYYSYGEIEFEGQDGMQTATFSAGGDFVGFYHSGTFAVSYNGENVYLIDMALDAFQEPIELQGTLTDLPGYEEYDGLGRTRGGSTLHVSYLGSTWVFEREH